MFRPRIPPAAMVLRLATIAICTALAVPFAAHADVYRWVGPEGTINYGSKPPPRAARLVQLQDDAQNLSVIPMPQRVKESADRAREAPAVAGQTALPVREMPRAQTASDGPTLYEDWRSQCEAERRVDCGRPSSATYDAVRSFSERTPYRPGLAP